MTQKKFLIKNIKDIFKKELKIIVKNNSKLLDFKSWDSLGNFNVLLAIEKKFKIRFNEKEFSSLNSFNRIKEAVEKKIKK